MKSVALLVTAAVIALVAPAFAPNSPTAQFPDRAYAPPSRIHFNGLSPFVYRLALTDRVRRSYVEDTTAPVQRSNRKPGAGCADRATVVFALYVPLKLGAGVTSTVPPLVGEILIVSV